MPLFGKKNKAEEPEKKGYPTGPPARPSAPPAPGYGHPPQADAPPPYSSVVGPPAYRPANPPQPSGYPAAGYPAPHGLPPHAPGTYQYGPYPQNVTVMAPGAYDAGARFDGIAQPNIPPPPPGVAPNAAQMAMMQGHNVAVSQRPQNFFTGGSDGGYTIW